MEMEMEILRIRYIPIVGVQYS